MGSCLACGLSSGALVGSWRLAPEAAGVPSLFHPQLEERASFDFAAWRKRYLQWIGHRKSRVLDIFHSIDQGQDGRLTQQEFIGRVLASKFPTSLPEMKAVAKIFDVNRDGFIDYYEFIRTLHPKIWGTPSPGLSFVTQVAECNCVKRFQVEQIGATRYRVSLCPPTFGECQQLRMVRILRSTLMVRVGGGWTALDEFLVKNDPCRGERLGRGQNPRGRPSRRGSQSAPASKMLCPSCSSLCLYSSASAPSSPFPRKVSQSRPVLWDVLSASAKVTPEEKLSPGMSLHPDYWSTSFSSGPREQQRRDLGSSLGAGPPFRGAHLVLPPASGSASRGLRCSSGAPGTDFGMSGLLPWLSTLPLQTAARGNPGPDAAPGAIKTRLPTTPTASVCACVLGAQGRVNRGSQHPHSAALLRETAQGGLPGFSLLCGWLGVVTVSPPPVNSSRRCREGMGCAANRLQATGS
uniref:Microtubule actin crosslinking factor 1 n=1 Tax=Laticauda laticaudata TaxID=8630 RepID=A0A8C5S6J7_LATLA